MDEYASLSAHHIPITIGAVTLVVNAAGGGDYTTIKAAMAYAAVRANAYSPYTISVMDGTYNEIQIDGADYVTVIGQSKAGTIMVSDGLRTDVDPVSGQRYVDMAFTAKHSWWIHHKMTIKNMTIRANDVKYCIHEDSSGVFTTYFDNVQFEHANGICVGCGLSPNQNIVATDCTFVKLGDFDPGVGGLYAHNRANMLGGGFGVTMLRCNSVNMSLNILTELGSTQLDTVAITDCSSDGTESVFNVLETSYVPSGTKAEVPYCINVYTHNSDTTLPYTFVAEERPDLATYIHAV